MGFFSTLLSYTSGGLLVYISYQSYKVYKDSKKNNKK